MWPWNLDVNHMFFGQWILHSNLFVLYGGCFVAFQKHSKHQIPVRNATKSYRNIEERQKHVLQNLSPTDYRIENLTRHHLTKDFPDRIVHSKTTKPHQKHRIKEQLPKHITDLSRRPDSTKICSSSLHLFKGLFLKPHPASKEWKS